MLAPRETECEAGEIGNDNIRPLVASFWQDRCDLEAICRRDRKEVAAKGRSEKRSKYLETKRLSVLACHGG